MKEQLIQDILDLAPEAILLGFDLYLPDLTEEFLDEQLVEDLYVLKWEIVDFVKTNA